MYIYIRATYVMRIQPTLCTLLATTTNRSSFKIYAGKSKGLSDEQKQKKITINWYRLNSRFQVVKNCFVRIAAGTNAISVIFSTSTLEL